MKKVKSFAFDVAIQGKDEKDIKFKVNKLKEIIEENFESENILLAGDVFVVDLTTDYEKNCPDVFEYFNE